MAKEYGRVHKTRFGELAFTQLDARTWMFLSMEDPARPRQVGEQYASKAELLADLTRYAREAWGLAGGPAVAPSPPPGSSSSVVATTIGTYDDGRFVRTAIVLGPSSHGTLDVLDADGRRVAQINVCCVREQGVETLVVDTIDVEKAWASARALAFGSQRRECEAPGVTTIVSADFRRPVPSGGAS